MKLSEFMPELPGQMRHNRDNLSALNNNIELLAKGSAPKEVGRANSLGLDLGYGSWMGQEFAFRQNLIAQLLEFAKNVEEVRAPIHHITNEVFRRGFLWKPKFACRCDNCGTEYQDDVDQCLHCDGEEDEEEEEQQEQEAPIPNMQAPSLGSPDGPNQAGGNMAMPGEMAKQMMPPQQPGMGNPMAPQPPQEEKPEKKKKGKLKKPDYSERRRIEPFLDDCNIWNQSLEEVLRMCWFDINAIDDMFIHIVKEYTVLDDGTVRSKPVEIRKMNPGFMEWDLDTDGLPKNSHYMCYIHREDSVQEEEGECEECGCDLIPIMYKYYYHGTELYFFEHEIIHESKFMPSETYGYSPILTLLFKIMTIRGMDAVLYRYFYERRTPSSLLLVSTDDAEALRREREFINVEMRRDPSYTPIVAVSTKNQRGRVDMVRLFHTLQEMEYLPVREEIRERISAMWGVTPIWQASNDAASGLSLQSQQLVVMSRVVESDQRLLKEKILTKVIEAFGINDWVLELQQPEEKAEVTRISFAQQRISAVNMLVQMGFTVELESDEVGLDDINFKISGKAMNPQEMMGGMPPMGGGMGGDPAAGGQGGMEMGTGEGVDPNAGMPQLPPTPMEKSVSAARAIKIVGQIRELGYDFPMIKNVSPDGSEISFLHEGILHKAKIREEQVVKIDIINKQVSPKMHRHKGQMTYHDINIKHNMAGREGKEDDMLYGIETPEKPDIDNDGIFTP